MPLQAIDSNHKKSNKYLQNSDLQDFQYHQLEPVIGKPTSKSRHPSGQDLDTTPAMTSDFACVDSASLRPIIIAQLKASQSGANPRNPSWGAGLETFRASMTVEFATETVWIRQTKAT